MGRVGALGHMGCTSRGRSGRLWVHPGVYGSSSRSCGAVMGVLGCIWGRQVGLGVREEAGWLGRVGSASCGPCWGAAAHREWPSWWPARGPCPGRAVARRGRVGHVDGAMGCGLGAWRVVSVWDVSGGLGARVGWVDGVWGVVRVRAHPGVVANGGPRQWHDRHDVGRGRGKWGMCRTREVRPGGACGTAHRCGAWGTSCSRGS